MSIAPVCHTRSGSSTDNWITPRWLIDALGPFDLDPCASAPQPWRCAETQYTVADDGLSKPWHGTVWLNPPYGKAAARWLARLAEHGDGMALVFARTETAMFFDHVWPYASALLFLRGRLTFHKPDGTKGVGNSGGPSVVIAYGRKAGNRLMDRDIPGHKVFCL